MHSSMQEFIARENVRRFKAQLESATDEAQKSAIQGLLDSERQHLQQILEASALQSR